MSGDARAHGVLRAGEPWLRPRPDRTGYSRDAGTAALLALGTTLTLLLYSRVGFYDEPAPAWLSAIVVAALTLPLAARRRYPEAVAIVISIAFFVGQQFAVPELLFSNITLFIAIYTVGAWSRHRRAATITRVAIIVAMFLWIAIHLIVSVSDPEVYPDVSRSGVFSQFASVSLIQVITNLLYFGGAFYFGTTAFAAARERAELAARTTELAEERLHSSDQAVALDRVRIARELHDVVAHHVSLMGVQAGAARRVLPTDPDLARQQLESIEQSARAAITELHRLLVTLRDTNAPLEGENAGFPDAADARSPRPPAQEESPAHKSSSTRGIAQLQELVEASRDAGIPTQLVVVGAPRAVSPLVGLTLYRLAQEALTNVRKHAGERATAELRLRYRDTSVEIEVTDTGPVRRAAARSAVSQAGSGLGHIGMRERVAAIGGTIEIGPRSRGGYLVRATAPDAIFPEPREATPR